MRQYKKLYITSCYISYVITRYIEILVLRHLVPHPNPLPKNYSLWLFILFLSKVTFLSTLKFSVQKACKLLLGLFKKYKQNKNILKKSWLIPAIDPAILNWHAMRVHGGKKLKAPGTCQLWTNMYALNKRVIHWFDLVQLNVWQIRSPA